MGAKETSRPRLPSLELPFGVGDFVDVLVTTSYDAEKMVYVQPVGFASQVSALMKEMGEWPVEVAQRLNDITPGALCAAPYPVDSLPYRAIVKKQTD
uniref:Tudor domain-containing protein n=1 Tax=Plectus sambesii TaxID=2011161 RepID=A0A914VPB8_9BILA